MTTSILIDIDTGERISVGDNVRTSRGEQCVVTLLRPSEGMNGRVYVRFPGAEWDREYFPSVINGEFT